MFPPHVPDYRKIGAEDAAERLENGVCAQGDERPSEVGVTVAEHDSQTDGGNDTCTIDAAFVSMWKWSDESGGAYARPIEKMKQRSSFFFTWSCRCQITGIGIRKIQMSVIRFEILVK